MQGIKPKVTKCAKIFVQVFVLLNLVERYMKMEVHICRISWRLEAQSPSRTLLKTSFYFVSFLLTCEKSEAVVLCQSRRNQHMSKVFEGLSIQVFPYRQNQCLKTKDYQFLTAESINHFKKHGSVYKDTS